MYQVMKRGHKVGHTALDYGSFVTAKQLGVTDNDLAPWVARGVLVKLPAPVEPPPVDSDGPTIEEGPVSDEKSKKRGKKDS